MENLLNQLRNSYVGNTQDQHVWISDIQKQIERLIQDARDDTLKTVRRSLAPLSPIYEHSRWQFINDCLTGAIESGHAGYWMTVIDYNPGNDDKQYGTLRTAKADIIESGDEILTPDEAAAAMASGDGVYTVTHETVELGLKRIRNAIDIPDEGLGNWQRELTSVKFLDQIMRNRIILADLTNDASILDAIDYVAILEIALFNEIRYH